MLGDKRCAVCQSEQPFSSQTETLWFCVFGLPVLPIESVASYWRCEKCLNAYRPDNQDEPSCVPLVREIIVYLLLGYHQSQHVKIAQEICLKLTGFDFPGDTYHEILTTIRSGRIDMVEHVRASAAVINAIGKQQILEAAFLTTNTCCDMQYEDRLRINLVGNALGVGLEFVQYAIDQVRKQSYYSVRRLRHVEPEV
jgi:hypothetical protein